MNEKTKIMGIITIASLSGGMIGYSIALIGNFPITTPVISGLLLGAVVTSITMALVLRAIAESIHPESKP